MKKKRLIPVLLLKNGFLVQSKGFKRHQNLGNPISAVKRLSQWASDEVIYLDISKTDEYDMRRDDLGHPNRASFLEIINDVAKVTFMPMTVGGKIKTAQDVSDRLSAGADKFAINTQALSDPNFIEAMAREHGSQCVVVSIDAKRTVIDGVVGWRVYGDGGQRDTGKDVVQWAREVASRGAGEILLQSIDNDGARGGYDLPLTQLVAQAVRVPVVALGGCGEWTDMQRVFQETKADAVAVANVLHYVDQSVYLAKKHLFAAGLPVRSPDLLDVRDDVQSVSR